MRKKVQRPRNIQIKVEINNIDIKSFQSQSDAMWSFLGQGFILIIPHRAANIRIITDMVALSDDFHPMMYSAVTKDDTESFYHGEKRSKEQILKVLY